MKKLLDCIEEKMGSDFRDAFEEAFIRTLFAMAVICAVACGLAALLVLFLALCMESAMILLWLIPFALLFFTSIFITNLLESLGV